MKRLSVILLLLAIPIALQAQAIGQVPCGTRVFSTGLPAFLPEEDYEDGGPKMSQERREIVIRCIERTFGKVKEYKEYWANCTGKHIFHVKLESDDEIGFCNGCMETYIIVSSIYSVGNDHLRGGLRVGEKLNQEKSRGEWTFHQSARDKKIYYFTPAWFDDVAFVIVDENGIIQSIHKITNDC